MSVYDCRDLAPAIRAAREAIERGEVICLPTDTVYGIGADPRSADAVTRLLMAKSRTRAMPPPILVASVEQARDLVEELPDIASAFIERFWPGALTLIFPARDDLGWDLGETNGTVALRMPDSAVALELLRTAGPLAVTSANITGNPPATNVVAAESQLEDAVSVYLDDGECDGGVPSTILRFTPKDGDYVIDVVREGAIPLDDLRQIAPIEARP